MPSALPPWGAGAHDDLKPRAPAELVAEYENAGVGRILLGVPDLENEDAFAMLEDIAGGIGLG
ncbi:MAG: hypothetical protein CMH85_15480 [Novosphingobium sp.]|nr:hypothetical protein [Novosphingobium sp.]